MNRFLISRSLIALLFFLSGLSISYSQNNNAIEEEKNWIPTGEWPYLKKRFEPATIVTGFVNKKKTVHPCNIHVGKHTLVYVLNDTLMQADPSNVNYVEFRDGDRYMSIGNVFAKIVQEDSVGRILMVRLVDQPKLRQNTNDISSMGALTIGGDFGEISMDLMPAYVHNPEEEPLPVIDTYFFNYNMEIFEVTDKNILSRIDQKRRKEYRAFTRSAEILSHNESSIRKIWDTFFVNY